MIMSETSDRVNSRWLQACVLLCAIVALPSGLAIAGEGDRDAAIQDHFDRLGLPGEKGGWIRNFLKENGLTDEQTEQALGGMLRVILGVRAQGENFELDPRLRDHLKRNVRLTDKQIELVVGLARKIGQGLQKRDGPGRERFQRARGSIFAQVEANPRDAALLAIARIKYDAGDHEPTIELLTAIIAESPQDEVKAVAHLAKARIYRTDLLFNDKAAVDFIAVRGPLGNTAILELMQMYEQAGEPEQGIQLLEAAAEVATEKADKIYFLGHVAEANRRAGRTEDALATLEQIVEMINYDESMELKDSEQGIQLLKAAAAAAAEKADKIYFLGHLAEAYRRAGRTKDALVTLEQIVEMINHDAAMELKEKAGAE